MRISLIGTASAGAIALGCAAHAQDWETFVFPDLGYSIEVPPGASVARRYGPPEDVMLFLIVLDDGTTIHFAYDLHPGTDALVDDFDDPGRVREDAEVFFLVSTDAPQFSGEAICARIRDRPDQGECIIYTHDAFRMMLDLPDVEDSITWPYVHVQFDFDNYDAALRIVRSFSRLQ